MMSVRRGGGLTGAALLSLSVLMGSMYSIGYAAQQVLPGDSGGGMTCSNCGQNQTSHTTGAATGGSAANQPNGNGSGFDIFWTSPNDGEQYSGSLMTQVVNADGSVTVNTISITVIGNGLDGGWGMANSARIPIGGSASISFSGTSASGKTFSAGWLVDNFGQ